MYNISRDVAAAQSCVKIFTGGEQAACVILSYTSSALKKKKNMSSAMTTRLCSSSALTFDNKAQSSSCSPPRSSPPELLILRASQHSPFLLCLPMPHWGSPSPDHTHPIVCLPRTFGRAINPLMAATYRSHNHQGRDDNLFVQNHLCRFSVDSHFTPNRGLLCGRGALAVPRLYLASLSFHAGFSSTSC